MHISLFQSRKEMIKMAEISIIVTKTIDGSGKWVPIIISEVSEITNVILEIKSVSVTSNKKDLACPWIASWNGYHIMKARHRLADPIKITDALCSEKSVCRVHGVTGMDKGLNMNQLSLAMQNNVRQYFLSDLHIAYAEARSLILEKGTVKNCLDKSDIVSVHSDIRSTQSKKIECIVVYEQKMQSASNSISKFLCRVIHNRSTCCLLEAFCQEQVQQLKASCRNVDTNTFPLLFYKDSRPQFPIVPLEGLEKMFDFFREIELESNLSYVNEKQKPLIISVYVPETPASQVSVTCKVEVCYRNLDDQYLSEPPECGPATISFNHPKLLSVSQTICGEKDICMLQNNLCLFEELSKTYKK